MLDAIQIYGDDEKIYGYNDLVVDVRSCLLAGLAQRTNPSLLTSA